MLRYQYTDNNEFGRRLRETRKASKMTLQEVADKLNADFSTNINKGTISKYENGIHEPSASTIYCLGQILGVSGEFLLGKTNLPFIDTPKAYKDRHSGVLSGVPPEQAGLLTYQITDDSMYPRYLPDDVLVIRQADQVESGQFCLLRLASGQTLIRRATIRDNTCIFQPVNTEYEPLFFDCPVEEETVVESGIKQGFTILGVVIELRRKEE